MKTSLCIVYEGDIGRPLTAATIEDRQLLVEAAKKAIAEAHERAKAVMPVDAFVGKVHREEANRLKKVLGMLIPELRTRPPLQLVPVATSAYPEDADE